MKGKKWIIVGVAAVLVILIVNIYNSVIDKKEKVELAWNDVEAAYQQRQVLVPQLTNIVRGYVPLDDKLLREVDKLYDKVGHASCYADTLNEANMKQYQHMQEELQGCLIRLVALTKTYPNLNTNKNFLSLQGELSDANKRISEACKAYNEAVCRYNEAVGKQPYSLVCGIFGLVEMPTIK